MLAHFQEIIVQYGALGALLAAFTEEVIVPIPSAIVMMSSGFLFLSGTAVSGASLVRLLLLAALPIATGLTLGSLVTYGLAYRYGREAVDRWGKYFGLKWSDVEGLTNRLERRHAQSPLILFFRLVPVIPSVVINITCGFIRYPLLKYLPVTFLGVLVRAYVLAFLGWQIGGAYHRYSQLLDGFEKLGLVAVVLGLGYWLYRRRERARMKLNHEPS